MGNGVELVLVYLQEAYKRPEENGIRIPALTGFQPRELHRGLPDSGLKEMEQFISYPFQGSANIEDIGSTAQG